jgi:NAD(P)-dependent dehydrogenase (short-subunit alcohol dehydrogenase family)
VVTGAASGIGWHLALRLAGAGYHVVGVDVGHLGGLERAVAELGGSLVSVRGDVGVLGTMQQAVGRAGERGALELVALNAGVLTGEPDLARLSDERYATAMGANVHGVVHGIRAVLASGRRAEICRVAVTASSAGLVPTPHDPVYVMTKHAVVGLVRSLALQGRPDLRINCVCPGGVDTPILTEALKRGRRLLRSEDVASRIWDVLLGDGNGEAWVCTPDRFAPFEFPPNPGYAFPAAPPPTRLGEGSAGPGSTVG